MKTLPVPPATVWLASLLLVSACSKPDPAADLEKTAAILEAAPAEPTSDGTPAIAPAEQLKTAMEDYKAGKMEDAVTRLQLLRATSTLSPEQRIALQDSVASVMAEIYVLAEKGDARAIAAVAQYERMQTRR